MSHVTVTLAPETERKLRHQASLQGQTLEVYLQKLAEREAASVNGVPPTTGKRPTLEELTAPISRAVAPTGMSDEEVGQFFEEAVEERRAERRSKNF
ncbi:MAG TPA: hypothetical protein VKD90_08845 [Gemmataceae bacterium]|nr:hypothetical protein [Gemmataceae bacterium]